MYQSNTFLFFSSVASAYNWCSIYRNTNLLSDTEILSWLATPKAMHVLPTVGKLSLIWEFFPWFWLKPPVFPWFPCTGKSFQNVPCFPWSVGTLIYIYFCCREMAEIYQRIGNLLFLRQTVSRNTNHYLTNFTFHGKLLQEIWFSLRILHMPGSTKRKVLSPKDIEFSKYTCS